jgi:dihydrolipoamide dehydrogenase
MGKDKTALAVIGGGPGGYAAAFAAADMGIAVTLIDPEENPGGVCLYRGCIPSKTLLHIARLIGEAREAKAWGVDFKAPKINLNRLRGFKEGVVANLTDGLGRLIKQRNITYLRGTAAFEDDHTLAIDSGSGAGGRLEFDSAIIATGSAPAGIPELDFDSARIMDSTSALEIEAIPKKLLVVGGGYIGLEIGSVYAALGARITLVELTPHLLPGVDRDLVKVLSRHLEDRFDDIRLETKVLTAKEQKNGIKVTLRGPEDEEQTRLFDGVLVAVGRRPLTDRLALDRAGVERGEGGFVEVDLFRRTACRHIYAIGDVTGEPMLAHKASHEGRIAAEIIAGRKAAYEPAAIPAVVFTDPEIAWAGLTETDARKNGIDHQATRFPWAASGRAATLGRSDGLTKIIVDPESERILGVGIAGPSAGEMISEGVLAIEMAANVTDLGLTIHPHPTLSETVKEAAEIFHGIAPHLYRPKDGRRGKKKN